MKNQCRLVNREIKSYNNDKHPSTTLRVTVRLSVVEVCFLYLNDI
jgi:hypothetical protein